MLMNEVGTLYLLLMCFLDALYSHFVLICGLLLIIIKAWEHVLWCGFQISLVGFGIVWNMGYGHVAKKKRRLFCLDSFSLFFREDHMLGTIFIALNL